MAYQILEHLEKIKRISFNIFLSKFKERTDTKLFECIDTKLNVFYCIQI